MKAARDYLIFPLDVASVTQARAYIERLSPHVGMFKIGLELFVHAGPAIVRWITENTDNAVFLDLKLYDIPVTVKRAMQQIVHLQPALTTVHCSENPDMLRAAVNGAAGQVGILGVTLLTSTSSAHLDQAGYQHKYVNDLTDLVLIRARTAQKAGCLGVVCSGHETRLIKASLGNDFITVTPGIRPSFTIQDQDDQKRVLTPAQAIENGADYLVIGRPIRDAADPAAAALSICEEIETAQKTVDHT